MIFGTFREKEKGMGEKNMCKVFCRVGERTKSCDVSLETHEALRRYTMDHGFTIQEVVFAAWNKYGVSERALKRYLSEQSP